MQQFDWQLYLEAAKELYAKNSEAYFRIVISRAYYAAYNIARNWLKHTGSTLKVTDIISSPKSHQLVWSAYEKGGLGGRYKSVGQKGVRLHKLRIEADYHDAIDDLEYKAERAIKDAEYIIDILV